jgi:hypothetical protein
MYYNIMRQATTSLKEGLDARQYIQERRVHILRDKRVQKIQKIHKAVQGRADAVTPGEADWGGHFRSRDIATLVAIRRKCTGHILKLSDTRRRPLAVSERTSKSNLYDNNTRKCQDNC